MSARENNFIVVSLGDKNSYGFDEHTLPRLIELVDGTAPDARFFFNTGVVAYYLTSRSTLKKAERVAREATALQSSDSKFLSLGIGVSEGKLVADFDWLGRVKSMPMGDAANTASRGVHISGQSAVALMELSERIS